jgi:NADH-ubiquinone oxidoreductase chain 6
MLYYIINTYINTYIIDILYYLSIIASILVVGSRNAIISIIYLIVLYISVSIYLYYIGLGIIGLLYILIYVGAITILFLFILSLMDIRLSELTYTSHKGDYLLISITVVLVACVILYLNRSSMTFQYHWILQYIVPSSQDIVPQSYGIYNVLSIENTQVLNNSIELSVISNILYTHYGIIFILLGYILLYSIITAITLLHNSTIRE